MRTLLWLAIAAVGCGNNDVHHLTDGGADAPGASDASTDAPPAPGVVSVTVTLDSIAIGGVTVYFQNADSSLVSETTTDGSGVASATMAPGGFVSVVEPQSAIGGFAPHAFVDDTQVTTFAGVKPGDQLRDDVLPQSELPASITINLTVPADANPSVDNYQLFTTCGDADITPPVTLHKPHDAGANPPVVVALPNGCNGVADMAVQAQSGTTALDGLFVANVAVADGGDVTLTGTYAAYQQTAPASLVDVPAEFSSGSYIWDLYGPHGRTGMANEVGIELAAGSGSNVFLMPPQFDGATQLTWLQMSSTGNLVDEQQLVTWGPVPTSLATDVGAFRLKNWVTFPEIDSSNETFIWTVGKDGQQPDYVYARAEGRRQDPSNESTTSWSWQIAAPGAQDGHIQLPTLPTDIFDFNFHDTDTEDFFDNQAVIAVQSPGGYDAARAHVFDTLDDVVEPDDAVLPGTGSVTVQVIEDDGFRFSGRVARSAARVAR